jgi:predicted enzyme related to lactoylglutathione lyase
MPTEPGAINGGMMQRTESTPAPVITIDVESIDLALTQVVESGGTTVTPRTPIPGMGAYAYFKDPEGNVVGLWETTP